MSVETIETKPDGKLEFDVIEGGKYKKRVTRGILYEDNFFTGKLAIAGGAMAVFGATFALTKHIHDSGLDDSFEIYTKFVMGDKTVTEDFEKLLKNNLKL
jgi:hypothetical protein